MAKYIDKDALIKTTEETPFTMSMFLNRDQCEGANMARHTFAEIFKILPAADVAEVRHAKFMPTKNFSGLKCSACGARVKNGAWRTHNWCYACGAKMDGGDE